MAKVQANTAGAELDAKLTKEPALITAKSDFINK
tara:strand:+ start:269 stop:370 length:102 start_codon:yes stop_codon:yes gene_type:complete